MNSTDDKILKIQNLVKDFPGVRAVNDVSFSIKQNTVHCLVGENGAGKSTLIKILTGAFIRSSGKIILRGDEYEAHNPKEARNRGIATLFQELNVVDELTVEENLTLGIEDSTFGFIRRSTKIKRILETLKEIEPSINPKHKVGRLSVAKKQIIEIAKAAASEAEIIIMDEPTASLSEKEITRLFRIIKDLRKKNVTVIYISHRLDEIFELGDMVTVMRDGKHVETKPVSEVKGRNELIHMMIGKTVFEEYVPRDTASLESLLEADGITNEKLKDISFSVKKGEIIGFYGLVGSGKTELASALFGIDQYKGDFIYKGKKLTGGPSRAINSGIALVPEERRTQGIFPILTIRMNIPAMNMKKITKNHIIRDWLERKAAKEYIEKLNIITQSTEKDVRTLSGGNQQKVVFAKCLFADADLLILDEPTRGVDVGAKSEIYSIVRQLSEAGKSIIVFSSELQEILYSCDRIYLLFDGELKAEMRNGPQIDSKEIINIATGGN